MEYLLHIGIMLCIYGILVISTNLTVGMANLLTLCQAAFYGIGAYVGTLLMLQLQLPLAVAAILVMLITGLTSLLVSFASARLKGDYFILATLGFQMIVYTVLYNWVSVTKGPYGIDGIPGADLFGLDHIWTFFIISSVLLMVVVAVFFCIRKSPFGRLLRAIRCDELSVQALGRSTSSLKARAFFISSSFAGLAGIIYASYMGYISPASFTLDESIFIITALFIGGAGGRFIGPLAGAAIVVILPELLRFVGLSPAVAANMRQVIYGIVLIILMFYRPQGLLGDYDKK